LNLRPRPPEKFLEPLAGLVFEPAPDLLEWLTSTFIAEDGALANPDHAHLFAARIGVLWTNVINSRHGKTIVGQCEFKPPGGTMGKWARGRAIAQLRGWFGEDLDFLLTFDAGYAAQCSDAEFCALVEHELYHAGQARDEFGVPKFHKDSGLPVFTIKPHDIEEFTGVIARYGAEACHAGAFVAAAATADVPAQRIAAVCGTCGG
jgi:hypothetical protein